ncbi:MAG: hypothetical protein WC444_04450 [Candidatus Paceibacterota bacterium]
MSAKYEHTEQLVQAQAEKLKEFDSTIKSLKDTIRDRDDEISTTYRINKALETENDNLRDRNEELESKMRELKGELKRQEVGSSIDEYSIIGRELVEFLLSRNNGQWWVKSPVEVVRSLMVEWDSVRENNDPCMFT